MTPFAIGAFAIGHGARQTVHLLVSVLSIGGELAQAPLSDEDEII